jgi:PAT family beta-lactamase induction signal transducer AmpG
MLYLVEAVPNSLVENVAPLFLQQNGVGKETATGLVATAALPWALKFLWSPFLAVRHGTHRQWLLACQAMLCAACAGIAAAAWFSQGAESTPWFVRVFTLSLAMCAFASATHDVVADGFYYTLDETRQACFIGVRNAAYRAGSIFPQALLPVLVGVLATHFGMTPGNAWGVSFAGAALALGGLALWHCRVLPRAGAGNQGATPATGVFRGYVETWLDFLRKRALPAFVFFLLFFRLPEVCVMRLSGFFLLDPRENGGLALDVGTLGYVNGVSTGAFVVGGLLGGAFAGRLGLRQAVWPLVCVMHLPNLAFVALAHWQPECPWWIGFCVALEKFGYGMGYTIFALVMLRVCDGPRRTAHYALAASLAYLGNLLPGYWVGPLAAAAGYEMYFLLILLAIFPSIGAAFLARRHLAGDSGRAGMPG